jgi:hypothetical protein
MKFFGLTNQRAWLCFYGDGDSDGRFIMGEDHTKEPTDECPVCGWDKSYHGCRWVTVTDA